MTPRPPRVGDVWKVRLGPSDIRYGLLLTLHNNDKTPIDRGYNWLVFDLKEQAVGEWFVAHDSQYFWLVAET